MSESKTQAQLDWLIENDALDGFHQLVVGAGGTNNGASAGRRC